MPYYKFSCICSKNGAWRKLFQEADGHLSSSMHQPLSTENPSVAEAELAAWDDVFAPKDKEFETQAAYDASARANKVSSEEQTNTGDGKDGHGTQPAIAVKLLTFPEPGQDSPWFQDCDDGIVQNEGQWFCSFCQFDVAQSEKKL